MTTAAWVANAEVVQVEYNSELLSFETLLEHAIQHSCGQKIFATNDEQLAVASKRLPGKVERFKAITKIGKPSDQLYYLGKSHLRFLPLTPAQSRRVNSALGLRQDPAKWLSPRQIAMAVRIEKALQNNPKSLDGLVRASTLDGLKAYQAKLEITLVEKSSAEK